jgi:hypothetical protein
MEVLSNFRSIEELVKMLNRESKLFRDMFEKRKALAYRTDFAMEVVEYKRERIQYLIDHGVVHENGDFLEMEDAYLQFFEDVLDMNEEISVASVKEYVDSIRENIRYFLEETNDRRRFQYQGNVRKILRKIGLRTLKNVVDLKRNVDVAYKQEPNYKIKKSRLVNLDEKRKGIKTMIRECERMMEHEVVFFQMATDPVMERTCMDVRNDFTEADHSLLEIEHQIIDYINQIEQQSALLKKIRKLKYLKDQLTWREDTNVARVMEEHNPVWMENRPYNKLHLSLTDLRGREDIGEMLCKLDGLTHSRRLSRTEAEPIAADYLTDTKQTVDEINVTELWNAFRAQGSHLFAFIRDYPYKGSRSLSDHVILYCQMATNYSEDLRFTEEYETYNNIKYALIYAK